MTAREYLYQAKNLDDYINAKLQEASQLRSRIRRLGAMNYDSTRVCGGKQHDFTDAVDSLIKLENNINKDIDRLVDMKSEIARMIDQLNDNRFKTVLTKYYLCNQRFEDISQEMKYSVSHIKRLHGLALNAFRKIYIEK